MRPHHIVYTYIYIYIKRDPVSAFICRYVTHLPASFIPPSAPAHGTSRHAGKPMLGGARAAQTRLPRPPRAGAVIGLGRESAPTAAAADGSESAPRPSRRPIRAEGNTDVGYGEAP